MHPVNYVRKALQKTYLKQNVSATFLLAGSTPCSGSAINRYIQMLFLQVTILQLVVGAQIHYCSLINTSRVKNPAQSIGDNKATSGAGLPITSFNSVLLLIIISISVLSSLMIPQNGMACSFELALRNTTTFTNLIYVELCASFIKKVGLQFCCCFCCCCCSCVRLNGTPPPPYETSSKEHFDQYKQFLECQN